MNNSIKTWYRCVSKTTWVTLYLRR